MATRKTTKIDPVAVTAAALRACKCAADYHTVEGATDSDTMNEAWATLNGIERTRLTEIINKAVKPKPQDIADELAACGTLIQLQAIKSAYGDVAVRTAWKLLSKPERDRLTAICQSQPQEEVQPVTEQPKRTLFSISDDLQHLNDLLDEVGDDAQQQELIAQWFETLGEERDRKLDGYAALISEMQTRADVRKAEARRMQELASTDENRARLLKDRLKWFFETHNITKVETSRYKLQLQRNGGKAPLILDESVPVTQLPEQFQKISVDADTAAIREVLERGEHLNFAHLGERSTSGLSILIL